MGLIAISDESISQRLTGLIDKIHVVVRERGAEKPRYYKGTIVSVTRGNQGLELHLETSSGQASVVERIPFCGLQSAITTISQITRSGGHEGIKLLYSNQRADEIYKLDDGSFVEPIYTGPMLRETLLSQGAFP